MISDRAFAVLVLLFLAVLAGVLIAGCGDVPPTPPIGS